MLIKENTSCLLLSEDKLSQSVLYNILKNNPKLKNIIVVNEIKEARKRIKNQKFALIINDSLSLKEEEIIFFKDSIKNYLILPEKVLFLANPFIEDSLYPLAELGIKKLIIKPLDISYFTTTVNEILA